MFTFKQFAIRQDRVAMKVCTDACVLGAFADVGATDDTTQTRLLDIGTGTGLLALMAAQRNPTARIDAIDIDGRAVEQARENAANSPFASQIRIWPGRIQEFMPGTVYDRILTNPPFYTNHLQPPDPAAARAGHTDELPVNDLLAAVHRLLKSDGQWWVLLPPYQTDQLIKRAQTFNLHPFRQLQLHHHINKPAFRIVTGFAPAGTPGPPHGVSSARATSPGATNAAPETLVIREMDNQTYTAAYRSLLRDFYLIF